MVQKTSYAVLSRGTIYFQYFTERNDERIVNFDEFRFQPFYPLYNYTYLFWEERNMSHNHEQRNKGW